MQDQIVKFVYWFDSSGWLGVVGLALTLFGFVVTFLSVTTSRKAAELARSAAADALAEVKKLKVIVDLSSAIAELEEVKRLGRMDQWPELPERLSRVRRLLAGIRALKPEMSENDNDAIVDATVAFSEIEKLVVRQSGNLNKVNANRVNDQLVDHSDRLVDIVARIM